MEIKSNIANPLALVQRKLISGLPNWFYKTIAAKLILAVQEPLTYTLFV